MRGSAPKPCGSAQLVRVLPRYTGKGASLDVMLPVGDARARARDGVSQLRRRRIRRVEDKRVGLPPPACARFQHRAVISRQRFSNGWH